MQKNGSLTIADIVLGTSLNIQEAEKILKDMATWGHVGTDVAESGIRFVNDRRFGC